MSTPEQEAAYSLHHFRLAWRLLTSAAPQPFLHTEPGLEFTLSRLLTPFLNLVFFTDPISSDEQLRSLAEIAVARSTESPVPCFFVVTEERIAEGVNAAAVLAGVGLAPLMPLTGMVAQALLPPTRTADGATIHPLKDEAGATDVLTVNGQAYGVDLSVMGPGLNYERFWKDHCGALLHVEGAPVSSSTVLFQDGVHYVALVATDPQHQKRGYAEAAIRASLEIAREMTGASPTVLHATESGRPVYERLGYRKIGGHMIYVPKELVEGTHGS